MQCSQPPADPCVLLLPACPQVCLDYDDKGSMSSETRARVEEEVRLMVQAAYSRWAYVL